MQASSTGVNSLLLPTLNTEEMVIFLVDKEKRRNHLKY
jgi:hypothetical protein